MTYIELLSTSRVRGKVVAYFASNQGVNIRPLQLAKKLSEDKGAVGHILLELKRRRFVTVYKTKSAAFYQINSNCPALEELKAMAKTMGEA